MLETCGRLFCLSLIEQACALFSRWAVNRSFFIRLSFARNMLICTSLYHAEKFIDHGTPKHKTMMATKTVRCTTSSLVIMHASGSPELLRTHAPPGDWQSRSCQNRRLRKPLAPDQSARFTVWTDCCYSCSHFVLMPSNQTMRVDQSTFSFTGASS